MAASTSADCLPNEILSMIMAYLGRPALKAARFVCRRWSSLVIRWLFDTVYISPRKLDLSVFMSITSEERLRWAVKRLVYDATYYELSMDRSTYLERLVAQVCSSTWSLEEEDFEAPDKSLNDFLIYASGIKKRREEERHKQLAHFEGLSLVRQGFDQYMENAKDQWFSFHTGLFDVILCNGLKYLANLETVIICDEWHTEEGEGEDFDVAEFELNTRTLDPVRRAGSFMARTLNPLFLEPSKWKSDNDGDGYVADGSKEYESMIRALSSSKSRIRNLHICPGSRSGIPGSFSAAGNRLQSSISTIDSTYAFRHLRVLNLIIVFGDSPSLSRDPLSSLKDLLPTMSELTDLDLTFGRYDQGNINMYHFDHVFEPSFVAQNLQSLALAGLGVTQDQLKHFLNTNRSIVKLALEDFMLHAGDWGCVLDDIREALPALREIDFIQPLQKLAGPYIINTTWDYETLDPVISMYVKKGGTNPFRLEPQHNEELPAGAVNP